MTEAVTKGRQVLRKLIGDANFARRNEAANSFNRDFQEFTETVAFAGVWSRPGLDWKTRSIACISALTATGLWPQLRFHIHSALNNGSSVDELRELMLHLSVYCGMPAASEMGRMVEIVLQERGVAPDKVSLPPDE
jgi:4-carboxymuconolactone decarboxylase